MPLTRIEILKGKSPEYKNTILQTVFDVVQSVLGIPDENRIQRLYELDEENFILGSTKSDQFTLIELTIFPGRSEEIKETLIQEITGLLGFRLGIKAVDVYIIINEPPEDNWGVRGQLLKYSHVDNSKSQDESGFAADNLYDIAEENLNAMAEEIGFVEDSVFFDESPDNMTPESESEDLMGFTSEEIRKIAELEWESKDALKNDERERFLDSYNDLWDIYDDVESNPDKKKILAAMLSDLTLLSGRDYYDKGMHFKICGPYNDSYKFARSNPDVFECAMACVQLGVSQLETKFTIQEFDNVESYIDELVPITTRFPDNEEFTVISAACLCNLLQLCPYDHNVFMSRMFEVMDQIFELGERFPENVELQLCLLRSIVFFLSYCKPRLREDLYGTYYSKGKAAFNAKKELISDNDLTDLRRALLENEIWL